MTFLKKTLLRYDDLTMKWVKSSPIVNDAFPGNFNLSFIEKYMLDNFGSYVRIKGDHKISKLQNVLRINDYKENIISIRKNTEFKNIHLSNFKMIGTGFLLEKRQRNKYFYKLLVKKLFEIFNEYNLDINKIYIKLCQGGKISELSNSKYEINKVIDPDLLSKNIFSDYNKNFIWDKTRQTFLSLNLFKKLSPWGYRTEVLYKTKQKLIELATFEYFLWEPAKNDNGKIIDINKFSNSLVLLGFGYERLKMISDNLNNITQIENIQRDLCFIKKLTNLKDRDVRLIYESINCFIFIYNEMTYTENKGHKKDKIKLIEKIVFPIIINEKISDNILKRIILRLVETENAIQIKFENNYNIIQFPLIIYDRIKKRINKFRHEKYK